MTRSGVSGNLGATTLPRRRGAGDPMQAYDALPPELRHWPADAVLPWSPRSCRRIWARAGLRAKTPGAIIARLDTAETRTPARGTTPEGIVPLPRSPFAGACR